MRSRLVVEKIDAYIFHAISSVCLVKFFIGAIYLNHQLRKGAVILISESVCVCVYVYASA
jgi:hypothetical protein